MGKIHFRQIFFLWYFHPFVKYYFPHKYFLSFCLAAAAGEAKSPLKALLLAWLQEVQQPASGEAAAGQEAALNSLNVELLLVQET